MTMNSIEERDNLIQLMQEALKFYADKNNYAHHPYEANAMAMCLAPEYRPPNPSKVELDGGSQAQFAINQAKQLIEQNQKIQDDYDKLIMETENFELTGETNPIELIRVFTETHKDNENPIV